MALGGSCRFKTTPFILRMRKYSTVKNLIMKYFHHSHSSRVQPSELVQGGFEVDVNITMYVKSNKPSQCGVVNGDLLLFRLPKDLVVGVAPRVISELKCAIRFSAIVLGATERDYNSS